LLWTLGVAISGYLEESPVLKGWSRGSLNSVLCEVLLGKQNPSPLKNFVLWNRLLVISFLFMCQALLQTEKSAGKKTKIHAFQWKEIKYVMIHTVKFYRDKAGKG